MHARRGLTLIDVVIVIGIVVVLAFVIAPMLAKPHERSRRTTCRGNLSHIAKAMMAYSELNGGFFPAHSQYDSGVIDDVRPMPSLATLYPGYVYDAKPFYCPATVDRPFISTIFVTSDNKDSVAKWTCFGTDKSPQAKDRNATNPVAYSGQELMTEMKCSYLYDERSHPRMIGPDQAVAADADGQSWRRPDGTEPVYPPHWQRDPRRPNHDGGQNVLYFGGNVKWAETVYAGHDPKDNIFCPNNDWGRDTDAYLWDGVNARTAQW